MRKRSLGPTQLARFIVSHRAEGVTPTALARESGYSRVHIYNVARGDTDPTREFMDSMSAACTRIAGRHVGRDELFEFRPSRGRKAS